ncbi:MAG: glycosyl transferase group 1 [Acidimicrobiales bacterium]|jgi:colanic acid/amylovoran biosynthesis glycosyltransferase|nr:glycosyl transferase group 1 [Acidimicrobiales bacterium]
MAERPAVMHFIERWLPLSEQFVHTLITRSRRPGVVVSSGPLENVELYPYEPLVCIDGLRRRAPERLKRPVVTACLMAIARRRKVGVIHVHHGYRAYEVLGTSRRLQLPFVVSLHGHDVTGYASSRPALYPPVLGKAAAVVVPSRFLVDAAVANGADPSRVRVIPSGVDTSFFQPTPVPTAPDVVFVGRFVEKKGLDTLLAAWPKVLAAVPPARLHVMGYGPLEALARSGGPTVTVTLGPDRSAVRAAIAAARAVVSPSHTAADDSVESLLVVNLEAQASGRPVVTTRHGGIPEYVDDGATALVVPEADADALADALVRVLTDDALAMRLGAAGPAWAAQFDVAGCAAAMDDLYAAVE